MKQSITEIAEIRTVVATLLDQLGIETYLFEIEPREGQWELTVECAIEEGWETIKLKADKDYFRHGTDDAIVHQLLLDEWREALSACKISKN